MLQVSNLFVFLIAAVLLSGCKLAIIVVEGGEVQSTGSGTCVASAICVVDVTDAGFSETFTAIPHEGWFFETWNSGNRLFCGGSSDPICTLSFQGHEESTHVADMIASYETFYLMPIFREASDTIEVDGKEWLQPIIFSDLSWSDIGAVCSSTDGICAGHLNGYDMNGWTWASVEDVNGLFNYYIGSAELGPGPDDFITPSDSIWGEAFYSDGWIATGEAPFPKSRATEGWLRDRRDNSRAYVGMITDSSPGAWYPDPGDWDTPDPFDGVITSRGGIISEAGELGGWFYRLP